jgi:hypothetical protein
MKTLMICFFATFRPFFRVSRTMRWRSGLRVYAALVIGIAFLFAAKQQALAEIITFDFDRGPGPSLTTFNSGNLFTLDLDGPDLNVSKPADDGSFDPTGFVSGGIVSNFSMTGDFLVTVDFSLLDFPVGAPGTNPLNESVLAVNGDNPGEAFLVLRFRRTNSDEIEAFGSSGGPIGVQDTSLTSGRYQIERVGDTLTGRFAPTGSDSFTTLGSFSGYTSSQFKIQLSATQGYEAGTMRSNTALDISFDNLVVEAGGFVGGGQLLNISTRMRVLTDDNVLIGGFIVTGISPKKVIVRAIGPSLGNQGVQGALADPTLELNLPDGSMITNDDWKETQQAEIEATTIPPSDDRESAMVQSLVPGAYTAIVRGKNGTTGVGLVEAYDLDQPADSRLANISTRGFIDIGDNVMIGGFIIGPPNLGDATVLVRAIGPSLANAGVADPLQDPTLELHDGNGALLTSNDDWKESQQSEIEATTIPPTDDRESAILQTLAPGNYTAILRGKADTTGVGLVEVYHLQ